MIRKKILALLLVCFILTSFMLAGCTSKAPQQSAETTEQDTEAKQEDTGEWKPEYPVQMIAPFAAGGAVDLMLRAIQPHMEKALGTPVAVINMPGGSASVATEHVYNGKKDGYTALGISTEIATMGTMGHSELTVKNWNIIGVIGAVPNVFVVNKNSPINTLDDLISKMKEGRVTMSCIGLGCPWSRGGLMLADYIGSDNPEFVPCGGGFPAAQAALKGEVDVGSCGLP